MRKATKLSYSWYIDDNKRTPHNTINNFITADSPNQEVENDPNYGIDLVSNGFKVRSSHSTQNNSGSTYIYMAFAEVPSNFANAR